MGHIFPCTCLSTFISLCKKMLCTCRGPAGLTLNFSNINFKGSQEDMDTFCDTSESHGKMNAAMSQESKFFFCLSLIWMSGSNMTKTPSLFADPSNEGYNCNKTWLPLPNYYRTDVLRPSTFRWFGGLLSLLLTAQKWAEILG